MTVARKREIYNLVIRQRCALRGRMTGDLSAAQSAIAKDPAAVNWTDPNDQATALLVAANGGQGRCRGPAQARADVNVRSPDTALHYLMVDPVSESRKKPDETLAHG
jgi:hypothetical protein